MRNVLLLLCLAFAINVNAQVAINTYGTAPDSSAMLDISSTTKGLLAPRMSSVERLAIVAPAPGLLVYDNTLGSYWYFNGAFWSDLSASASPGWLLTGNAATDTAINFIGTTDAMPLEFKVNNHLAGKIDHLSYNTSFGYQSLNANITGVGNSAIGFEDLYSNTSGNNNTANGIEALYYNTTGYRNTATGSAALISNTIGYENTANGANALESNTTGIFNTATGANALYSNTTGSNNTACGNEALYLNTIGYLNTAIGFQSLYLKMTGIANNASGFQSLYSNTFGIYNTANGYQSLFSNSGGNSNTANGSQALYHNTLGNNNSAYGYYSLFNNSNGLYNTAVGYYALSNNINGSSNIAVGNLSGTTGNFNNTVSIGNNGWLNAASNQAFIGNASTGWIGGWVGWSTYSDARIKNDIKEDVKGLDFITRLRPVTYHRSIKAMREITGNKDTQDYPEKYDVEKVKFSGFLAQEVEQAAKESGYDFSGIKAPSDNNDLYSLSYEQFVVPLVKAVQELNARNDDLTKSINELKKQNAQLFQMIEKLQNK